MATTISSEGLANRTRCHVITSGLLITGTSCDAPTNGGLSQHGHVCPICSGPSTINRLVCLSQAIRPSTACRRGQNGGLLLVVPLSAISIGPSPDFSVVTGVPFISSGRSRTGSIPSRMADGRGEAALV